MQGEEIQIALNDCEAGTIPVPLSKKLKIYETYLNISHPNSQAHNLYRF